jgi:hypothetical protein
MRNEIQKVIDELTEVVNKYTLDFIQKEIKYQDII